MNARVFVASVCMFTVVVSARPDTNLTIVSFQDGSLSWSNVNPDLYYTVEWDPALVDSNGWVGSYRSLQDFQSPEDVITVPVPIFFRVVGSSTQQHTLLLSPMTASMPAGY